MPTPRAARAAAPAAHTSAPANQLVPATDKRQLARIAALTTIHSAEECAEASQAIVWLKDRIKSIKTNEKFQRLKAKVKAAYDEVVQIERDALSRYVPLEKRLREEISRYQTAEARAREKAQQALTSGLTRKLAAAAAAPTVVEVGDDVFEFEPDTAAIGTAVVLQPADVDAGRRKFWKVALVDPAKPRDKDGNPIVNEDAGLRALCAAIGRGEANLELVSFNDSRASKLAEAVEGRLEIPGLAPYYVIRPVVSSGA